MTRPRPIPHPRPGPAPTQPRPGTPSPIHPDGPTRPPTRPHGSALPMDDWTRRWIYARQRGEAVGAIVPPEMTPRQRRRYVKKSRHHAARKDQP